MKILRWKVEKTRWFWNFGLGDLKNNLSSLKIRQVDFILNYIFEISQNEQQFFLTEGQNNFGNKIPTLPF